MACSINFLRINFPFIDVCIYAPAKTSHKQEFWDELCTYINLLNSPFIIVGDFNELSNDQDKRGGSVYRDNRSSIMQTFLSRTATTEIPFIGNRFTWRKKPSGWTRVLLV